MGGALAPSQGFRLGCERWVEELLLLREPKQSGTSPFRPAWYRRWTGLDWVSTIAVDHPAPFVQDLGLFRRAPSQVPLASPSHSLSFSQDCLHNNVW